jgi:putative PIN family toxin of toxin-antitoxin system
LRVVLDTSVWLNALLNSKCPAARIVAATAEGTIVAVSTILLWSELLRVLEQEEVRQPLERTHRRAIALAAVSIAQQILVFAPTAPTTEPQDAVDPGDAWLIQSALTGNAEYIVTNDWRLLFLGRVGRIRIRSPAEFVAEVLDHQ